MPNRLQANGEIQSFDEEKRELYVRVLPWDTEVSTERGVETFQKGSFEGIDPGRFIARVRHMDPPTGRGISLEEKDDALYMGLRIARTAAGDEQLELAREGIETGVSVGFEDGDVEKKPLTSGRFHYNHKRVKEDGVLEISTTYKPAFGQASQVLQVLERTEPVAEEIQTTEAPAAVSGFATDTQLQEFQDAMLTRLNELSERQKAMNVMQVAPVTDPKMERTVDLQLREIADIITTGNSGVLPPSWSSEMLGRIFSGRPFLNSTTQVPPPATGMQLVYPKITQGPLVGTQATQKTDLASQATAITTVAFDFVTKGGAADISMQLLRRSSPEFLSLFLELLGEAYANNTEDGAVDALLATTESAGGEFDVTDPSFGEAFANTNSASSGTMKPDRIWLSTAALVEMMDARIPSGGGGTPYYPSLAGIGGGLTGGGNAELGFQLQPVWVPALDDEAVDLIIGPSRGFAWAEDGTYTLQADVPTKFGRDVGLAGMIWYAPLYPLAFTSYTLAAS